MVAGLRIAFPPELFAAQACLNRPDDELFLRFLEGMAGLTPELQFDYAGYELQDSEGGPDGKIGQILFWAPGQELMLPYADALPLIEMAAKAHAEQYPADCAALVIALDRLKMKLGA